MTWCVGCGSWESWTFEPPLKARGPAKPVMAKVTNAGPMRCLCCRNTFQSKDRVRNRICVPCKGTEAW